MTPTGLWRSLSVRERRLVMVGALSLFLATVWMAVLDPWYRELDRIRGQVPASEDTLRWMEREIASVRDLIDGAGSGSGHGGEPLLTVIERSAGRKGLRELISRIQPVDGSRVRVWFDEASFDDWLLWIDALGRLGIVVDTVEVARASANAVHIRVTLARD